MTGNNFPTTRHPHRPGRRPSVHRQCPPRPPPPRGGCRTALHWLMALSLPVPTSRRRWGTLAAGARTLGYTWQGCWWRGVLWGCSAPAGAPVRAVAQAAGCPPRLQVPRSLRSRHLCRLPGGRWAILLMALASGADFGVHRPAHPAATPDGTTGAAGNGWKKCTSSSATRC